MRSPTQLLISQPSSFSKAEWQLLRAYGIVNGYGPRNAYILRKLLKWLAPMFREANADWHDLNFLKGGTEEDRLRADNGFFIRLIRDSLKTGWLKGYYIALSIIFYLSVRVFGGRYFNLKKTKYKYK